MKFDKNVQIVEEHRKDLLRQADQYRLIQKASTGTTPPANFWTRLLQWLGQLLIHIRCLLQTQLSRQGLTMTEMSISTPCEE